MKLCVFQGTFNPIHNTHLKMAQSVAADYDKVLFIPAYNPPHKDFDGDMSAHRLEMVRIAVEGNPKFEASDIEYRREGKSYTYDTIRELYKLYPVEGKIGFIIGSDAFEKIDSWHEAEKLKELVDFIVFERTDDVSSTEIRERITKGFSVDDVLPKGVLQYIREHNLYIEGITDKLAAMLNDKRYLHSCGTAEYARKLARKFGLDEEKAYIAGLLHDCAKGFDNEKLAETAKNLEVSEEEFLNLKTLHAPVGAHIAEKEFNITDKEILRAIRRHTLGHTEMSVFDKIIFLADKIEPSTRPEEFRIAAEKLLEQEDGLDKALLECYRRTIEKLTERGLSISPGTIEIYNLLNKEYS